jgi:hypothetical protein
VNHRQLGVDLFNEVWRLMDMREDDVADTEDCEHLEEALADI